MDISQLSKLYRTTLMEFSKDQTYRHLLEHPTHAYEIYNPSCGDLLYVQAQIIDGVIEEIAYTGEGCAISTASAHLMCKLLQGQKVEEADQLEQLFKQLMTAEISESDKKQLKEAVILEGVYKFPMRIRCATLAWEGYHEMQEIEEGEETK